MGGKEIEAGKECLVEKSYSRKLDPYRNKILEWLEKDLTGVRIFEELTSLGVKTGHSTVKDYIADIKKREDIFVRIHTKPGEEAQVDFGYVGLTLDNNGKRRKTWIFNMRLSYSRKDYYEKVYNQRAETFIECHINAFNYFGGVPEYVKIDNLKAAVLRSSFYEPIYQSLYKSFADHYGFKPIWDEIRRGGS
ncbi:MAG: IS21 family transposase [Candidatus Firestonebacteria bacterium]